MLPFLKIGPLIIQTPGLIYLLSLWIGLAQSERFARRLGENAEKLYNLVLVALVAGILGARLTFAAANLAIFSQNPASILSLSPVMLNIPGGLLTGVLAALIYGQRKGLQLWPVLDLLTPTLAVLMIGISLANLASGAAFGAPAQLPWSILLWGELRHPSQVYAILVALVIAVIVWPRHHQNDREAKINTSRGLRFLAFTSLTALAQLFLDRFRGDSLITAGTLHTTQVIAWVILALALFQIGKKLKPWEGTNGSNSH